MEVLCNYTFYDRNLSETEFFSLSSNSVLRSFTVLYIPILDSTLSPHNNKRFEISDLNKMLHSRLSKVNVFICVCVATLSIATIEQQLRRTVYNNESLEQSNWASLLLGATALVFCSEVLGSIPANAILTSTYIPNNKKKTELHNIKK